jgi:Uma2 family endonuclease
MENEVKESAPRYDYITPEEYLGMERKAEYQNEYYYGQVLAMSGASLKHNLIERNLLLTIGQFLKNKNCSVLPSNMRVTTPSHDSYMYPDATIVCGEPELEDDQLDTLQNPSVIFEILSPSTRSIDKGRKFFFYQRIPSLREYIMVDTTKKFIQIARRQADNSWKFEDMDNSRVFLNIRTIQFDLPLEEIYNDSGL